jgi:hypothetical protein
MEERILVAIATSTSMIVDAIHEASAEQNASREAMAERIMERGAGFLRDALDEGARLGGPANDTAP